MDHNNYKALRSEIKSGDIVAWNGRFTNHDILNIFNQKIGHIGIALVISGRVFVIHSLTKGVVINPLSRLLPFFWLETDSDWTEEVQIFAMSELGRSYSYADALRSAIGFPANSNNGWTCGEYAKFILQKAKVPVTQYFPSKLVDEILGLKPNRELIKLF